MNTRVRRSQRGLNSASLRPCPHFQVSSLQSTLCPLQNFLHAITLCLVRRRVTYLLSQCKFLTRHSLNSEQQGFCFQNLSSTLTTKETTTTDKEQTAYTVLTVSKNNYNVPGWFSRLSMRLLISGSGFEPYVERHYVLF